MRDSGADCRSSAPWDRGEGRGLGDVEFAGTLPEVALARDLDTVRAIAEVDLVEVELEDLVLGIALLDVERHTHLAQLAAQAAVAAVDVLGKEVARELHGDGGRTGDPSPENGSLRRTEDADPVDAMMLVEALVLGGQEGLNDGGRDLVEGHYRASLEAQVGDEAAIGRIHLGRLRRIVLTQRIERGAGVVTADREPGGQHDGDAEGHETENPDNDGTDNARRAPAGRAGGSGLRHIVKKLRGPLGPHHLEEGGVGTAAGGAKCREGLTHLGQATACPPSTHPTERGGMLSSA